ncbi:hypothetical protein HMI54_001039 [Coelomomyces lativittatus]|nr:hypothetical protein HMI55_003858 [Coelomomyces lativittatus]KAJ1502705.1 hypothetical protein HMI56_002552 [Coelomomyces lativittatus]KAJ1511110.1 hypothetical protein HMI54_001039 [Coelomomyces lativittatus]
MILLFKIFTLLDFSNHLACITFLQLAINASNPYLSIYQQSLFSVSRSLLLLALLFHAPSLVGSSPLIRILSIFLKLPAFLVAVYFTFINHQALLSFLSSSNDDPVSMVSLTLFFLGMAFTLHLIQFGASLFAWFHK